MSAISRVAIQKYVYKVFRGRRYFSTEMLQAPAAIEEDFMEKIHFYSRKKQTSVSLQNLLETSKGGNIHNTETPTADQANMICIQIACFLRRELPIRLARRVVELESLPVFTTSPSIRNVCSWYKSSFIQIQNCPPPDTVEKEQHFATLLESLYERHSSTLINMARGACEVRKTLSHGMNGFAESREIQTRLDEFYMSRIGLRVLVGQYLELRRSLRNPQAWNSDTIGIVHMKCSVKDIASDAARDASYMCTRMYGDAPDVTFHGRTDLHFPYIPSHLSYMLLELLKNSMRATAETHGVDKMPPIRIVIGDGEDNEDVSIKISDEGGGIKRSNMKYIWSYLFTTASPTILENILNETNSSNMLDFTTDSPLAGLGYGLPISRNYARYFDGDLTIMSMEGYGTDSFIHLPRLGNSNDNSKLT